MGSSGSVGSGGPEGSGGPAESGGPVGSSGLMVRAPACRLIPPLPFRSLGNFVHATLSFGRDSKSLWSLLSGVYARGSKIFPHTEMEKTVD